MEEISAWRRVRASTASSLSFSLVSFSLGGFFFGLGAELSLSNSLRARFEGRGLGFSGSGSGSEGWTFLGRPADRRGLSSFGGLFARCTS
jgi:hypothetical protein